MKKIDKDITAELNTFIEGLKQDEEDLPNRLQQHQILKLESQRLGEEDQEHYIPATALNSTNKRGAIVQVTRYY